MTLSTEITALKHYMEVNPDVPKGEPFKWSSAGLDLLSDIKKDIAKFGGRIKYANEIMLENPGLFTMEEKRNIKYKMRQNASMRANRASKEKKDSRFWSQEDINYLMDNYGYIKTCRLASTLNRKTSTIKKYFQENASRDRKKLVPDKFKSRLRNLKKYA